MISGASVVRIELNDRGDPAAFDLTQAGMTMDNAWHDWDVSAIVGPDASWVLLRANVIHSSTPRQLMFRKNGNANLIAMATVQIHVADILHDAQFFVPCDVNGVIEYKMSAAADGINVAVLGWIN